jgi:outer membrane murein-binding lipoprotein Lpp
MIAQKNRTRSVWLTTAALVLGGLSLSACATQGYVDEQIATVNSRIDGVDAKASDAIQRADAANSAAQSAAASAQQANQRLDAMEARVGALETRPAKAARN